MNVIINGESKRFDSATTLADLIDQLGMKPDRVAVELNRELVPRERWATTWVADGNRLEIVHFVGGGNRD
jgi:thiamine biosynthesis protein ThiS